MVKLKNCLYNKIKLMHELSSILWFIEKHAHNDVAQGGSTECVALLEELERDLEKHVTQIQKIICK